MTQRHKKSKVHQYRQVIVYLKAFRSGIKTHTHMAMETEKSQKSTQCTVLTL